MYEIINYVFTELQADTTLQGLFGGTVPVYHFAAEPDTSPPFLVMEMNHHVVHGPWGFENGDMTIHVWTSGARALLMYQIRDSIVRLLERRYYPEIAGLEAVRFRKTFESSVPAAGERNSAPNTLERIHHRVIKFGVRWCSKKDIDAVLGR